MSQCILEMVGVTKCFRSNWTFRPFLAIEDLSLAINTGEVYGLIGHNGAGKTTTLKLIIDLLRPTRGTLRWNGARIDWNRCKWRLIAASG